MAPSGWKINLSGRDLLTYRREISLYKLTMVERTSPRRRVCRQFSIPPEPNSKRVDGRHAVVNFNISTIYIEQTSKYLDFGTIRDDIFQIFQLFASIGTAFVKTFDESGRHAIINFNNLYLQLSTFRHSSWIPADMLVIFQLLVSIEPAIFTVLPTYSWTFNFWNLGFEAGTDMCPPFPVSFREHVEGAVP